MKLLILAALALVTTLRAGPEPPCSGIASAVAPQPSVYAGFDPSTCGKNKTCVLFPEGCEKNFNNCLQGVAFSPNRYDPDSVDVEQFANNFTTNRNVYLAMAFKAECGDVCMANTRVVECSSLEGEFRGNPTGRLSYNNDKPENVRIPDEQSFRYSILNDFVSTFVNGQLSCKYTQTIRNNFIDAPQAPLIFSMAEETQYTVLLAAGPTNDTDLKVHYKGHAHVSSKKYSLLPPATLGCPCVYASIWHDVVLVIDGSSAMNDATFKGLTSFLKTTLSRLTVGQSQKAQTRIGVVVFGNDAQVLSKLSTLKSTADFGNLQITQRKQGGPTNMRAGVDAALQLFKDPSEHRKNVKTIMVIAGQDFQRGIYDNASPAVAGFRNNGGIVIAISDGPSEFMKSLSSPSYYFQRNKDTADKFMGMLCDANCFCPPGYKPVSLNYQRGTADHGCFLAVEDEKAQPAAQADCKSRYNGFLAAPRMNDQMTAVLGLFYRGRTDVLIGLKRATSDADWVWADGYLFYEPGGVEGCYNCGTLKQGNGFHVLFESVQCNANMKYACQTVPCSSINYCL